MTAPPICFDVHGRAEPAGSKKGFLHPATKQVMVTDANPRAKSWKQEVASAAAAAYRGPLLTGPLSVAFVFFVTRPKGHYRTGSNAHLLKDSAPEHPTVRPDLLKLARGVEDALTGVVYTDDSLIVDERLMKMYGPWNLLRVTIAPVVAAEEAMAA